MDLIFNIYGSCPSSKSPVGAGRLLHISAHPPLTLPRTPYLPTYLPITPHLPTYLPISLAPFVVPPAIDMLKLQSRQWLLQQYPQTASNRWNTCDKKLEFFASTQFYSTTASPLCTESPQSIPFSTKTTPDALLYYSSALSSSGRPT